MIIDAHHHFWRLDRGDYGWLTPELGLLYRDYEPADLAPEIAAAGVAGGIVIQAAPSEAETHFLLSLADHTPSILGIVGWTEFDAPQCPATIDRLAANRRLLGLRPMLQDLPDDFIVSPAADRALAAMQANGLRFEALVRPRHLSRLVTVRERHPDLMIIVDHCAKPDIAGGAWSTWAEPLQRLAADGRTVCKLSGLVSEAAPGWTTDTLRRWVDLALDAFGPNRLLWGSDWPVLLQAGAGYGQWLCMADQLLSDLSADERAAVFGETARRVYGLKIPSNAGA